MMALPADPTLDELRDALAPLVAANAAFDGWNVHAVDSAADALGVERSITHLGLIYIPCEPGQVGH